MVAESAEFKTAVEDSRKLKAKPTADELLELYALYKVGTGEDISKAAKPGMFDIKGKAKFSSWDKKHKAGLSAEEAQKEYVTLVEKLKEEYGYDA